MSASFNCNIANTTIEKKICSNEALSTLDDQMNLAYNISLMLNNDEIPIRSRQGQWLLNVRNRCATENNLCLRDAYHQRIQDLNDLIDKIVSKRGYADATIKNRNPQSCAPQSSLAKAYVDPNSTSDTFNDRIGDSWSFDVQGAVKIAQKNYKIGKLISPRGGIQEGIYYIDPTYWTCN